MELLKKAIESAKTAQSARLKRLEDNCIEFDKLNNTVKSAMKELGLTQFILETSIGKFTINSNNGMPSRLPSNNLTINARMLLSKHLSSSLRS